jgi:hypothetical protein
MCPARGKRGSASRTTHCIAHGLHGADPSHEGESAHPNSLADLPVASQAQAVVPSRKAPRTRRQP